MLQRVYRLAPLCCTLCIVCCNVSTAWRRCVACALYVATCLPPCTAALHAVHCMLHAARCARCILQLCTLHLAMQHAADYTMHVARTLPVAMLHALCRMLHVDSSLASCCQAPASAPGPTHICAGTGHICTGPDPHLRRDRPACTGRGTGTSRRSSGRTAAPAPARATAAAAATGAHRGRRSGMLRRMSARPHGVALGHGELEVAQRERLLLHREQRVAAVEVEVRVACPAGRRPHRGPGQPTRCARSKLVPVVLPTTRGNHSTNKYL